MSSLPVKSLGDSSKTNSSTSTNPYPDSNPNSHHPNPNPNTPNTDHNTDPNTDPYPNETLHTLNLDLLGKPLSYSTAKSEPDRLLWTAAEAEEILRLIATGDRLRDVVYYNPVVKQKRNDDGTIKYRVRDTAGGNLLDVPYDV